MDDFAGRMRNTDAYAATHGFRSGFPNYFDAQYAEHVCGTLLLGDDTVEWRDADVVNDLLNVPLGDIGRRFQASMDLATRQGFVGGFPNLNQAQYNGRWVCGTLLVKPGRAVIREYALYTPPA